MVFWSFSFYHDLSNAVAAARCIVNEGDAEAGLKAPAGAMPQMVCARSIIGSDYATPQQRWFDAVSRTRAVARFRKLAEHTANERDCAAAAHAARVGRHDIIPSGIWVALFSRCQRYRC